MIPFAIKHWKEVLIVSIIAVSVWKYYDLVDRIDYLTLLHEQDVQIIKTKEANETRLRDAIDLQNERIDNLKNRSDKQKERLEQAQDASESVKQEYEAMMERLMTDKPQNVVTCEDNMEWMVDKGKELKWKF